MTRALLLIAALCAAVAIGYVLGVHQASRPVAPAAPHVQITTAPPAPSPAKRAVAKAAPAPAPSPSPVAPQDAEAQVAEDAAAVGLTTREPEGPSSIDDVLQRNAAAAPPPETAPSN